MAPIWQSCCCKRDIGYTAFGAEKEVSVQRIENCSACSGTGSVDGAMETCSACRGTGRKNVEEKIPVRIPPGVDNGDRLRVSGKGEGGVRGGAAGDLYVVIHVRASQVFERDGVDLYCKLPIDPFTAMLGGVVEVPTVSGMTKMKVEAGTQSGAVLRIKGKGMPGHMGHKQTTVKNLEVVRVDAEKNLLLVKGAVPGPKKALVTIKETTKANA